MPARAGPAMSIVVLVEITFIFGGDRLPKVVKAALRQEKSSGRARLSRESEGVADGDSHAQD